MNAVPPPDRPWLREMWSFLGENDNSAIDPLWDVDPHFSALARAGTTHHLVAELDAALATERDGHVEWPELSVRWEGICDDGPGDTASILRGLRHRALTVGRAPHRVPDAHDPEWDGVAPPRETWFADERTEVEVRQLLWDANRDLIETFGAGETGWAILHLYADLAAHGSIGWARDLPLQGRSYGYVPAHPYPVSSAVLLVDLDDDGVPRPSKALPEVALDADVRERFPALCHFLGGWFHPHRGYVIWNGVQAMRHTDRPAFDQVRDELDALLAEDPDDDRCRAVAMACGSYVLPQRARHWMDLLRWRFDGYDWGK